MADRMEELEAENALLRQKLSLAIWDRLAVEELLFKLTGAKWIPHGNTPQPDDIEGSAQ